MYVKDIGWYRNFFEETLGMKVKQVDGTSDNPQQVWTVGGLQFIADPNFNGPGGQMAHLGIVTEDLDKALQEIYSWDHVSQVTGKEKNWVLLPDGLILELFEQKGQAVREILAIEPR